MEKKDRGYRIDNAGFVRVYRTAVLCGAGLKGLTGMSALTRQHGPIARAAGWHADVLQLLDDHHLVATSPSPARRVRFGAALGSFLLGLRDAEVCTIYGLEVDSLDRFCAQVERSIAGPTIDRRIDGPRGLTALLRHRETFRGRPASKFRYYLWHDADVLLGADELLFARLADALAGVAAEAEYASDDLLLIHRAVFIGGPALDEYAARPDGQLRSWYRDGHGEPFWRVVAGVEAPPFLRFDIDRLR